MKKVKIKNGGGIGASRSRNGFTPDSIIYVGDLVDDYFHAVNSQDVRAIKKDFGRKASRFESFFVLVGDGEYEEVYGAEKQFPRNDDRVYPILGVGKRNPKSPAGFDYDFKGKNEEYKKGLEERRKKLRGGLDSSRDQFLKGMKDISDRRKNPIENPRKITQKVVYAFNRGEKAKSGNTESDGKHLRLHGNMIAKWEDGSLWVTTQGWSTPTTKERLNALPSVSVYTIRGQLYLNGQPWDGRWTRIDDAVAPPRVSNPTKGWEGMSWEEINRTVNPWRVDFIKEHKGGTLDGMTTDGHLDFVSYESALSWIEGVQDRDIKPYGSAGTVRYVHLSPPYMHYGNLRHGGRIRNPKKNPSNRTAVVNELDRLHALISMSSDLSDSLEAYLQRAEDKIAKLADTMQYGEPSWDAQAKKLLGELHKKAMKVVPKDYRDEAQIMLRNPSGESDVYDKSLSKLIKQRVKPISPKDLKAVLAYNYSDTVDITVPAKLSVYYKTVNAVNDYLMKNYSRKNFKFSLGVPKMFVLLPYIASDSPKVSKKIRIVKIEDKTPSSPQSFYVATSSYAKDLDEAVEYLKTRQALPWDFVAP